MGYSIFYFPEFEDLIFIFQLNFFRIYVYYVVEYLVRGNKNSLMKKAQKNAQAIKNNAAGIARLARLIESKCLPDDRKTIV